MPKLSPGQLALLANAAYLTANHGLTLGMRLVYVILLARLLGPEVYGVFAYAMSWYLLFMPLTSLGQGLILAREIGGNRAAASEIATLTLSLRLLVSLLVGAVCLLLGWLINAEREGLGLLLLFSLAILPRSLALWGRALFIAFEQSRRVLVIETVFRTLEVVIGSVLLLLQAELYYLVLNHLLTWSLQAAVSMVVLRRHCTPFRLTRRIQGVPGLLRQGIPLSLTFMAEDWLVSGPVVVFRQLSDNLDALGQLALCTQILGYLKLVPTAVHAAAQPALRRAMLRADGNQQRFTSAYLALVLLQSAVLALAAELFGNRLLAATVGSAYAGVADLLMPIAWIAAVSALGLLAARLSALAYQVHSPLAGALLGLAAMLVLAPPLTGLLGYHGTLLATLLGTGVAALWNVTRLDSVAASLLPAVIGLMLAAIGAYLAPCDSDSAWQACRFIISAGLLGLCMLTGARLVRRFIHAG